MNPSLKTPANRLLITIVAALLCMVCGAASAATAIRFTLDRPIDGAAAPFIVAADNGLFAEEGLNVTTNVAAGSKDAIGRVAAGTSDIALADLNVLIRLRDNDKMPAVKAVFVLFDTAPYALIGRKSRGIENIALIEGKTLGLVDGDPAARLWPFVAKHNGVRTDKLKTEKISAAVREPLLSAGQVDAVSGFSFLAAVNVRDRGVPADDLAILHFSDFGCMAYGYALVVNPKFAAANPDAVKAFIRATIAGVKLSIKHPSRAIDSVIAGMNGGGSHDLELERLQTVIRENIVTDDVKRNGIGAVAPARFDASVAAIAEDFKFQKLPALADIFDASYLPAESARQIH
ncbi:nitrate ABC transporter substrate-binding protein [Afipia sp. Root123D2]|uniref:ABC transporter substrate-binding protein n=1 Tax=Afipia sp. Root123D2 TaxID=1736436 RepID=UPI0006FC6D15|nr:ABC transporter substrate-binding protein [Afipia sp. Root123D2]KQW19016.1 nitrate ABC transporter substrate-binding protein [Afipia sp. Root123D2]